jgi:hypothetical protein
MLDRAPWAESVKPEDRIFHATDLESLKDMYRDWTQGQKQRFQNEAYRIIEGLHLFPIATAVIKADYERLRVRFAQFKQGYEGNYYLHSLHDVLKNVYNWLEAQRFDASVLYVFEAGTLGEFYVGQTLERILNDPEQKKMYRMRGYSIVGKDVLPVQAADIWAYESYKQMVNRIIPEKPERKVRYPYQRLYRNRHHQYQTYWDYESLAELLRVYRELEAQPERTDFGTLVQDESETKY